MPLPPKCLPSRQGCTRCGALLPDNGYHLGVAPHRDFLLDSPATVDQDPATISIDQTMHLSRKAVRIIRLYEASDLPSIISSLFLLFFIWMMVTRGHAIVNVASRDVPEQFPPVADCMWRLAKAGMFPEPYPFSP